MTSASEFAIVSGTGFQGPRFRRARVEKTNAGSGLHHERRSGDDDRGTSAAHSRGKPLSRYETDEREPLWNGPSLNAAFAAQLIGQVLETRTTRDGRSVLAAYRDRSRYARAFDRRA
jgi:hypothetical protein